MHSSVTPGITTEYGMTQINKCVSRVFPVTTVEWHVITNILSFSDSLASSPWMAKGMTFRTSFLMT